ncbi:MAG TPA: CHAT domain-containing protein [Burkholderiales bacterium]
MQAGLQSFHAGAFAEALGHWNAAASAYQASGNSEGALTALMRAAEADLALGRNPDALAKLSQAQALAQRLGNQSLLAAVENSLGNAYLLGGRRTEAEPLLRSSVERARKSKNMQTAASALNNLGNLRAAEGRFDDAGLLYREAQQSAEAVGNKTLALRAAANRARSLVDARRYGDAASALRALDGDMRALEQTNDKAVGLISIGRLYARILAQGLSPAGEWSRRSYAALTDGLAVAEVINDARARSYALGYLGELYEQGARREEALQFTQRAIVAAQQADAPDILFRWQWQAGRLLRSQGDGEQAMLSYQQAVATLATVRQDLTAGGARTSFRESIGPVYSELADLLLERSASLTDPKLAAQHLVDARSTMELFKGAELQDYFQDDCVTALRARTTGIDQLAPRTAALYPIILKDRLELLLTLPDGIKRFTTRVPADALTGEIRAFRLLLEKRTTHQYYPHARKLYDWLIAPIAAELDKQQVDTLVIVPDGALRTIPLAALHDGEQFLIARYALVTTPGLTLTDPRPLPRERAQLLLNGLTESVQGFAPLPYVAEELQAIHKIYGGTMLQNGQFTLSNMEKGLEQTPYSIVHIASHGQFDSDSEKTFLLTYEGKLSMDKLEQFLGLSKFRTEAVELLTLSACQTAAGDDRAALGLAGVAIKAGARSALATLWTVNDPASALMVSDFYRHLRAPGVSKAKALQQAQLGILKDIRYRHPNYWSAFLLIGNWL